MKPFAKMANFCKKLNLRGREFQPRLKFQLVKPWLDFISYINRQQCKNRIAIIWKSFITINLAEISPRVWTTQDEVFISCKRIMIDCACGFKLEKQTDVYLSKIMSQQTFQCLFDVVFRLIWRHDVAQRQINVETTSNQH